MKETFKKILPDLVAILLFVVLSFAYFFPAALDGRILSQHDSVAGIGAGQEAKEYREQTGEVTRWSNAIFGGMPTYQTAPSYSSTTLLRDAGKVYTLFLPNYVWLLFIMMLGFYILLRVLDMSARLAALGAIIWAFSSYFFIIISAGHLWKFITLAYIPPTIAGIVLAYKGKYLWGGIVTAFFVAMQILSNHVQMTYYFLFVILFMVLAYFEEAWKSKQLPRFFKATGTLVVAALVGISINISSLYHTYEYSKETMRGKSELVKPDSGNQTKGGLERSYITQWSYGIGETFSLLVPNVKGGASVPLAENESAMQKADPMYAGLYSQIGQYWGEQPGTSGPVYVGAFVLMLFILGMFILKGPMKWALFGATVLSVLLAWGKNFMPFTDFFLDFIPMYDKFRAVSSILVIAEFTIPLLAVLTLKEIIDRPAVLKEKLKYVYVSFGLTGGIALLMAVAPRLFFSSYISTSEMQALQQGIPGDQLGAIVRNLEEIRVSIFTSDAWRSFFVVVAGTLLLLLYTTGKLKARWLILAVAVLCLGDMWLINKRYLNDGQFVDKSQQEITFRKTPTDEYILQDKTLDYRVLNLATSTFNENNTAYWHKSVGGYHAAKLRRYQEMIEYHLTKEMQNLFREVTEAQGNMDSVHAGAFPVLNMLNTRYFIFPAQDGQTIPLRNPYAFGNAWFVEKVNYVGNANEEIEAVGTVDPLTTAIVDVKFREKLGGVESAYKDSLSSIELVSYKPNELVYETSTAKDGVVVFSEIYYPGWQAYLDGKEVEHGRANYIFRAMNVPAGQHKIEFKFDPRSLHVTEGIAFAGMAVLVLGVIGAVVIAVRRRKKE